MIVPEWKSFSMAERQKGQKANKQMDGKLLLSHQLKAKITLSAEATAAKATTMAIIEA